MQSRRDFLRFLLGSPLLLTADPLRAAERLLERVAGDEPALQA